MGFLKYRIPNQKQVSLKGDFRAVSDLNKTSGFVLSDFNQSIFHQFCEGLTLEDAISPTTPYCVTKSEYLKQAEKYIGALKTEKQSKAILSRIKKIDIEPNEEWFEELCLKYPKAFVYHFKSEQIGEWIGATPELLVEVNDNVGRTVSLAGTKTSKDNSAWGDKEKEEQSIVTNYILGLLNNHCTAIELNDQTELIAGPVKHLLNTFQFNIKDDNIYELIQELHPTPAVMGFPLNFSSELIKNTEKHQRLYYAGFLGVNENKKTELFVNLRCAQIIDKQAYLYLGGGLTKDSVPEMEWQETENKAKTLLDILQNN